MWDLPQLSISGIGLSASIAFVHNWGIPVYPPVNRHGYGTWTISKRIFPGTVVFHSYVRSPEATQVVSALP